MKIAVTGISGYLGSRILAVLDRHPHVETVVGIDRFPPRLDSPKLRFVCHDVTQPFPTLFDGIDVALHLVFALNPLHDEALAERINIGSAENFLDACGRGRVGRVVMMSSTTAYGAHRDNPAWLTECDRTRGNSTFQYSHGKAQVERLCAGFQAGNPDREVVVIRPPIALGPTVNNFLSRFMRRPVVFLVAGCDPPFQFIHEDDLARGAVDLALRAPRGAYNLAPDDTIRLSEVAALYGARVVRLPKYLIYPLTELAWRLRLTAVTEAPAEMLQFVRHPWVATTDKVKQAIGFTCRYSSREAVEAALRAR